MDVEGDGHVESSIFLSMHPLDTIAEVYNKVLKYEEREVNITPGVRMIRLVS